MGFFSLVVGDMVQICECAIIAIVVNIVAPFIAVEQVVKLIQLVAIWGDLAPVSVVKLSHPLVYGGFSLKCAGNSGLFQACHGRQLCHLHSLGIILSIHLFVYCIGLAYFFQNLGGILISTTKSITVLLSMSLCI